MPIHAKGCMVLSKLWPQQFYIHMLPISRNTEPIRDPSSLGNFALRLHRRGVIPFGPRR